MTSVFARRALCCLVLLLVPQGPGRGQTVLGRPADWSVDGGAEAVELPVETDLRAEPAERSVVIARVGPGTAEIVARRDGWLEVRIGGRRGWILPAAAAAAVPDEPGGRDDSGGDLRLAAQPVLDAVLWPHSRVFGGIAAYGDSKMLLRPALSGVEEYVVAAFAERYGLPLLDLPHGHWIWATRPQAARQVRDSGPSWRRDLDLGYVAPPGYALHTGARLQDAVPAMVHQVAHLVAWHRLRRADLPGWLEEGLAEDLAMVSSGPEGKLRLAPAASRNLRLGDSGRERLERLHERLDSGALDVGRLLGSPLSAAEMSADDAFAAAMLLRYWLQSSRADALRGVLGSASRGGGVDAGRMATALGLDAVSETGAFTTFVESRLAADR